MQNSDSVLWQALMPIVHQVRWFKALRQLFMLKRLKRATLRIAHDYWTIDNSTIFDRKYYLAMNPDVARSGNDPLLHYLLHGEREGRRPNPRLSVAQLRTSLEGGARKRSALAIMVREGNAERSPETRRRLAVPAEFALPRIIVKRGELNRSRLVVYTAVFDAYDSLPQPRTHSTDVDYVCFTERQIEKPGVWELRSLDYFHQVPRRMARYAKLHPHRYFPDYDWSLWVDGRIVPHIDPLQLLSDNEGKGELFAFYHPERNNPFEESEEVIRLNLDQRATVVEQMARYHSIGLDRSTALHETGVLLRRHNSPKVIDQSRIWWTEIERGSTRDQLSFDYSAWRAKLPVAPLAERGINVRNDHRFVCHRHSTTNRAATVWASNFRTTIPPSVITESIAPHDEADQVDIVICVHNALDDVIRCIESVERSCEGRERLILVDDGSASETRDWLRNYASQKFSRAVLIRREIAGGYTIAANVGLRETRAPNVVMLNSDTIVPRTWLKKLHHAAHSAPEIGLVGPLSNAASYQSVPDLTSVGKGFLVNVLPPGISVDDMDAICGSVADGLYPRVPALNGFCMLIRRSVIERIGLFDEVTFPEGYGEENDFCLRAAEAGFSSVIACDGYVYHAKSRSYTEERRTELVRKATAAIKAKWSESRLWHASRTLEDHPWLALVREQVANKLAARSQI
jgi:O-antigen biosynthesis protein